MSAEHGRQTSALAGGAGQILFRGYGSLENSVRSKHKVPHPYSRAEENTRSLTGFGMTRVV